VKYVDIPIQSKFEGATLPIPTFPLVFKEVVKRLPFTNKTLDPVSLTHKVDPTVSVFDVPNEFPMATLPVVTSEFEVFVRSKVFEEMFPKLTTCSRVSRSKVSEMFVILLDPSTVIMGMREVEPYAPADVVEPTMLDMKRADP
jgi:hypothetical protein